VIIEVRDIIDGKVHIAHTQAPPADITLGYLFDQREELKRIKPCVAQVKVNSIKIDQWQATTLRQTDSVEIDIAPRGPVLAVIQVIMLVISLISTIVSMVMRPKPTKLETPKETTTYSWDGLKTSYAPGGPIPVVYGEHASGGQLLSLAIDVNPANPNQQVLSMLLGEGCGTITNVDCIKVNGISFSNFNNPLPQSAICQAAADRYWIDRPDVAADPWYGSSPAGAYDHYLSYGQYEGAIWHSELCTNDPLNISWDWRTGASSQSAIPGFELSRNTFADGREISSLAITYPTQGNQVSRVQLQVAALQGLGIFRGGTNPRMQTQTVYYRVEYSPQGAGTYTTAEDRAFSGADKGEIWDAPVYNLPSRAAWDFRLTWIGEAQHERSDLAKGDADFAHIWLRNVTEMSDAQVETYSGTALLSVKAIATNQLQGGPPTISAVLRGRNVRAYYNTTTYVTTWTRNPAWGILDYMTNSVYGMGPFIPTSAINIQSFIDFATLCDSQVSNGAGGLEPQHCLDIVMDKKKPHIQWVNDMLGLYRSALIYSQGKFKIITDRGDLPVRQIFHAGNILPGTFQLTIGATDPTPPNQVNLSFPNRMADFNMDTIFVQDSASIYGRNEPIKDVDLSLIGVTRESEAVREGYYQLQRRRQSVREMQFATGIEALAVEPGDMCKVGIVTTGFEMGYGGRVLEGDLFNVVLDREVTVNSGYTYEFYLWHTQSDSPEVRTVATTPPAGAPSIITITVSPSNPFNIQPQNGDRWAIGITSEDLRTCFVKRINFDPQTAKHSLVVQEYVPTVPITPTLVSTITFWDMNAPPAQPLSVKGGITYNIAADGTVAALLNVDVVPAPLEEGGQLGTVASSYVVLSGSHCPVRYSLNGDMFRMNTGSAGPGPGAKGNEGAVRTINYWTGSDHQAFYAPGFQSAIVGFPPYPPNSGDRYTLLHRGGFFDGFDLYRRTIEASADYSFVAPILGTHYEETVMIDSLQADMQYKVVPFNTRGVRNYLGDWEVTISFSGTFVSTGQTVDYLFYEHADSMQLLEPSFVSPGLYPHSYAAITINKSGATVFLQATMDFARNGGPQLALEPVFIANSLSVINSPAGFGLLWGDYLTDYTNRLFMDSISVGNAQKKSYTLAKTLVTTYAPMTIYFTEFGNTVTSVNLVNLHYNATIYSR